MAALWPVVMVACLIHLTPIHSTDPDQCVRGKFGDGCRFDCHCNMNTACDRVTGSCFYGCEPTWMGDGCQTKILSVGSATQSNTVPPREEYVCEHNRYRQRSCSNQIRETYDASNALTDDKCARISFGFSLLPDNWWRVDTNGDYVITQVQLKTNEASLEILVGPSIEVNDAANSLCATTSNSQTIQVYTCRPALRGRYIILRFLRPAASYNELCNVKIQGYPFVDYCPKGYHGSACMSRCRCMIESESCNHVDGSCASGCSDNYVGPGCDIEFQTNQTIMFTADSSAMKVTVPEWTELRDSRRGLFQVQYILEIYDETWRVVQKDADEGQFVLRDLKPYSTYSARVILARRSAGNVIVRGPPGKPYNFTTPCGVPTSPPEIISIECQITNMAAYPSVITATVTWRPVPEKHLSCDVIGTYKLEYRLPFDTEWTSVMVSSQNASETMSAFVPNLSPYTLYEFRMMAINHPNLKAIGDIIASKTPEGVAGPVQTIDVIPHSTSAEVRWLEPNETNGVIISYEIQYSELEIIGCANLQDPPRTRAVNRTTVVLNDLKPSRKYNVTVSAMTTAGHGPVTWRLLETTESAPVSSPTRPSVVGVLSHSARVIVYHLACHLRNGQFREFNIQISNNTWNQSFQTEMTVLDVYNLRPHTVYTVQYSWNNMVASSPWSEITNFTTLTDVPGPPRIVDHVTTPRTISLLWKRPSQDYGSELTHYEAVCTLPGVTKSEAHIPAYNMTGSILYHTFDGPVKPNRVYQCKVRANTVSGAGQWSTTKRLSTVYHNTMPVRDFTVSAGNVTVSAGNVTVSAGNVTVSAGNVTVSAGNVTVSAGNMTVSAGNVTVSAGNVTVTMTWLEPIITHGILGYKIRCHDDNSTEAVLQKNMFLGATQYTWTPPSMFADLNCDIRTYTPKGDGPTTNGRGEVDQTPRPPITNDRGEVDQTLRPPITNGRGEVDQTTPSTHY